MIAQELRAFTGTGPVATGLQQTDRPTPAPGPGEIRVALGAASLNYRDLMMVRGLYNPKQPLPLIPGSDGAGSVDAVGPGVTRWRVGQRVTGAFHQGWSGGPITRDALAHTLGGPRDGCFASHVILKENGAIETPGHLSDLEAACLPCAWLTAWVALTGDGGLPPGGSVLIIGTGGVSIAALQLATAMGARCVVVSGSPDKLERARELGAVHGVDRRQTGDWGRAVRQWTNGHGVDVVVEVGGSGTLAQSIQAVRPDGRIAVIGVLSGAADKLDLRPILMNRIRLQGIMVGSAQDFSAMADAVTAWQLKPVIGGEYPLADAPAALDAMATGSHFGKLALRIA